MGRVRGVRCCSRLTRHGVQQMAGRHWARAANAKSYSRLSELFSQCQWQCGTAGQSHVPRWPPTTQAQWAGWCGDVTVELFVLSLLRTM